MNENMVLSLFFSRFRKFSQSSESAASSSSPATNDSLQTAMPNDGTSSIATTAAPPRRRGTISHTSSSSASSTNLQNQQARGRQAKRANSLSHIFSFFRSNSNENSSSPRIKIGENESIEEDPEEILLKQELNLVKEDVSLSFNVISENAVDQCLFDILKCNGTVPSARSGHIAVIDPKNSCYMHIFGGYHEGRCYNDFFSLHLPTQTWVQRDCKGDIPSERVSHQGVVYNSFLLVFGGSNVPFGHTNYNDFYKLDLATFEWIRVELTGEVPSPRYGHSIVIHDHKLYLFGGTSGRVYHNDFFEIDLKTSSCRRLRDNTTSTPASRTARLNPFVARHNTSNLFHNNNNTDGNGNVADGGNHGIFEEPVFEERPSPRYRHEAVCDGEKMYIIGGGCPNPIQGKMDIFTYTFATDLFEKVVVNSKFNHTMTSDELQSREQIGQPQLQLHNRPPQLPINRPPRQQPIQPVRLTPRVPHRRLRSILRLPNVQQQQRQQQLRQQQQQQQQQQLQQQEHETGNDDGVEEEEDGVDVDDDDELEQIHLQQLLQQQELIQHLEQQRRVLLLKQLEEDSPKGLRSHSCMLFEGEIFLFGGTDGSKMYSNLWKFTIKTKTWTLIKMKSNGPRCFHSSVISKSGQMLVFGGCVNSNGSVRIDETASCYMKLPSLKELCIKNLAAIETRQRRITILEQLRFRTWVKEERKRQDLDRDLGRFMYRTTSQQKGDITRTTTTTTTTEENFDPLQVASCTRDDGNCNPVSKHLEGDDDEDEEVYDTFGFDIDDDTIDDLLNKTLNPSAYGLDEVLPRELYRAIVAI